MLKPQAVFFVRAGSGARVHHDTFLVRVVAGRTGDAVPGHQRKDHLMPNLSFAHDFPHLGVGFDQEVLVEKNARHGRVAPPAQKSNVRSEFDVIGPVHYRVGLNGMALKAYRLAVNFSNLALAVEHVVWIDRLICLPVMAAEAAFPAVGIRSAAQQFGRAGKAVSAMNFMAGQALDLPIEQWQLAVDFTGRFEVYRVMVGRVVVAIEAGVGRPELGQQRGDSGSGVLQYMTIDADGVIAGMRRRGIAVLLCRQSGLGRDQQSGEKN